MASEETKSQTLLWGDYLVIVLYFLFVLVVGLWVRIPKVRIMTQTNQPPSRRHGNLNGAA